LSLQYSGDHVAEEAIEARNKMREIKTLTNLAAYDINTLMTFFLEHASPGGHISKGAFFECFAVLVERNLEGQDAVEKTEAFTRRVEELLEFLFCLFDADSNNVIDISELSAGLSVLSGGSRDSKVRT
jgi:hypothetical protein